MEALRRAEVSNGNQRNIAGKGNMHGRFANQGTRRRNEKEEEDQAALRHLKHGGLQDAEVRLVFRELRPTDNLAPIHRVRLLLPSTREETKLIVSDAAVHEEQSREHAIFDGDGDVNRSGDLAWRHEPVGNIAVCGEGSHVVAVEQYN